jgi:DNA-binding NtrC family response regulator
MRNLPVALIVATHPQQCRALVRAFDELALRTALAFTVEDACRTLESADLTLVVTAPALRDGTYHEVLRETQKRGLPLVLMPRREELREYPEAARMGVAAVLGFPFSPPEVEQAVTACGVVASLPKRAATA